ncbi:MAG: P1 family peptidase [Solirubrobacteraceae bacterium]
MDRAPDLLGPNQRPAVWREHDNRRRRDRGEAHQEQANRVATVAHDGIGRAVRPAHTMYDGDTIFCIATGTVVAPDDPVEVLAAEVVARAIAQGVRHAGVR